MIPSARENFLVQMLERTPVIGRALIRRLVRDSQSCSSGESRDASFGAVVSLLGIITSAFSLLWTRNHTEILLATDWIYNRERVETVTECEKCLKR